MFRVWRDEWVVLECRGSDVGHGTKLVVTGVLSVAVLRGAAMYPEPSRRKRACAAFGADGMQLDRLLRFQGSSSDVASCSRRPLCHRPRAATSTRRWTDCSAARDRA